ncbi:hypothetical protein EV360DRAFT_67375 [Lentinula raphanica]|nr:hypothetical protein EV360DRAFT_67375 [Lentinula raphanica]
MPPLRRMFGLLLQLLIATPYVLACPLAIFPSALNSSYLEASLMERSMDPILPKLRARKTPPPMVEVSFQVWNNNDMNENAPKINPDKEKFHDPAPNSVYVPYVPAEIKLALQTLLKTFLRSSSELELEYKNDFPYDLKSLPKGGSNMLVNIRGDLFHVQINEHWIAGLYDAEYSEDFVSSLVVYPAYFIVDGVRRGAPEGRTPHVPDGVKQLVEDVIPEEYKKNPDANPGSHGIFLSEFSPFKRAYLDFKNDFLEGGDETTFSFVFKSLRGTVSAEVINGFRWRDKESIPSQNIQQGKKRVREGSQSPKRPLAAKKTKVEESNVIPNPVHRPKPLIEGH